MPATPSATGAAATGALSGAAAGTAVMPGIGTAIGAVVGGIGGYLSGSGTADAQAAQNKAGAQAAAAQSAQSFYNYLAGRGINLQQLVAQYPEFQAEYDRVRTTAGEKRDFNTWLVAAIQNDQSHPIWNAIANPAGTAGAANTTLPAWAVDANGNQLQPSLLNQIVGIANQKGDAAAAAQKSAIADQWATTRPDLRANWEADPGYAQIYGSFENYVLADYQANATPEQKQAIVATAEEVAPAAPATQPGPAGTGNNTTLDPAIAALIPNSAGVLNRVFDGSLLSEQLKAMEPVNEARDAAAAAQAARIVEQRTLSGDLLNTDLTGIKGVLDARRTGAGGIYDATVTGAGGVYDATLAGAGGVRDAASEAARAVNDANITKLADLLGVRKEAAAAIYAASTQSAGGVRDARTTGAKGIYDAELLQADTYGQAANQALSRSLAEQSAERARRGFTGGSSGSDITRARLNAEYLQRGAGARAGAGVNYAGRLSDTGVNYATDIGRAGIGQATTIGQANEADAAAKLAAAVQLAQQLGLANTNYATTAGNAGVAKAGTLAGAGVTQAGTLASAGEQDAIARLQAQVADATRRLGYLTADADIAKANADLQKAQDALKAITDNQNRLVGAVGAPFNLAGLDLGLKGSLDDQQYAGIDAILKRIGSFSAAPAGGPTLTTSTPGSVLNPSQIAGGALSGLGSVLGNSANQQSIAELLKMFGTTTPAASTGSTPATGTLTTPSNFLSGASVFKAPGG